MRIQAVLRLFHFKHSSFAFFTIISRPGSSTVPGNNQARGNSQKGNDGGAHGDGDNDAQQSFAFAHHIHPEIKSQHKKDS